MFSLFIETDKNHVEALSVSKKLQGSTGTIIIPEDVFGELVNILGKKFGHEKAFVASEFILSTKIFLIEGTTEIIRTQALEKFKKQAQAVSYTDCVVMAFADYFQTKEIFGFDKAFTQNGYILPQ